MRLSKRRKDVNHEELAQPFQLSFEDALEVFLTGQDAAGHTKVTFEDYRRVVGQFLGYMAKEHQYTYIQQITEQDILSWLAHLRNGTSRYGRPYSSRTIRTYSVDVFAFFNWLFKHQHLETNPVEMVDSPKIEKPLIRVFTDEEVELLDAACDREPSGRSLTPDERKALAARDRAILWLLLSTGIRLSELSGLHFCDIDWDKNMIYVFGKGAKERKVPFGKVARQHLNTYLQYWRGKPTDPVKDHVFTGVFGRPLTHHAVKKIFDRLKVKAGIRDKRVSAHTCRHWFAVKAIKNGMPSTVLQGLLGHERLEMINVYVHLAEQDNQELYSRYSPADSLKMHQQKDRREEIRGWRNARKHQNEGK